MPAKTSLLPRKSKITRPGEVSVYGISRSTALRWEKTNSKFPKLRKFGPGVSGWLTRDLDRYFGLDEAE